MSKSRARLLAELLNSAGRVKKDKSDLAGADSIIDLDTLPTITNAKLENSSISVAGHSVSLGGTVTLDTADISEHTDYPYFTNARARGAISAGGDLAYNSTTGVVSFTERTDAEVRGLVSAGGSLSYNSSTGVISYTQPTNISTFTNDSSYITNATASLNADKITAGVLNHARIPIPANGDWWNNGYVRVQTDGVMEVGKYLDFHASDSGGNVDYDVRVTASSGAIDIDGNLTVDAITASGAVTWSGGSSTNANTAYGWGDHASAGYLTSHQSLAAYAPLASPALTGTPTAPTASAGTNTTQIATTAFVGTAVSNLVDSAPGTLNTLNELAAALGDDANFSTTVTNSIATKLPLAGGTMTGALSVPTITIDTTSNTAVGLRIQRASASGRAQMTFEDESNSAQWRVGMTGGGSEDFSFFDGSANVLVLDKTSSAATFSGDITGARLIASANGTSTSPTISISSPNSASFIHASNAFAANMTAGQFVGHFFGRVGSTKNAGGIGYYYSAAGSDNNFISLGHWGNDHLFRIYGNGTVRINSGDLQFGSNTVINSSRNITINQKIDNSLGNLLDHDGTNNYIKGGNAGSNILYIEASGVYTNNSIIVGNNASKQVIVRHIDGKSGSSNSYENLYLNYYAGNAVIVGRSDQNATLQVHGPIQQGTTTVIDTSRNLTNIGTISSGAITSSGKISASDDLETATRLKFTNNITNGWSAPIIFRESAHLALSDYSGVKLGGYNGTSYGPRVHVAGNGNLNILEGNLMMAGTTVIDTSRNITAATADIHGGGSYPLQVSSTQRYQIQVRNPNNTTNSSYGWWLAHDTDFDLAFHADGSGDKMTLSRAGNLTVTGVVTAGGGGIFNNETYVRGASNVGLRIQTTAQGTGGSDGLRVGLNGVHAFVWQFEALPLAFATSGTERLSIGSTGTFDYKTNNLTNIGTISSGALTSTGNSQIAKIRVGTTAFNAASGVLQVDGNQTLSRGSEIRWVNGAGSTGEYIYSKAASPYDVTIHSGGYDALQCPNTGEVILNHNGAARLTTVSNGINVGGSTILIDSHAFARQAEYSGTSIFSQSGDWYTLAEISESTTPAYFALKFSAHSTVTFSVTTGYVHSNVATINVLGSTWTQNGGYPGASELRIVKQTDNAAYYVQMRLTYSSSSATGFNLAARTWGATPSSGVPSFVSSLAVYSATHSTISHVYTDYNGTGSSTAHYNNNGSNSLPSYSFSGDTNTGMYRDTADSIGFATNGAQRATISNSGLDVKSGGNLIVRDSADLSLSGGYTRVTTGSIGASNAGTRGFIMDGNYTNGQYRHRWRKQDNGGGVPLYLDYSSGTANSFTAIARFGPYSSNNENFEVYGNSRITGNLGIGMASGVSASARLHVLKTGAGLQEVARFSNFNTGGEHSLFISVDDDNNYVRLQSSGTNAGDMQLMTGNDLRATVTANVNSTNVGGLNLWDNRLGFDQSGTRSWTMAAAGGNLNVYSGDGNGAFVLNSSMRLQVGTNSAFINSHDQYHGIILRGVPNQQTGYGITAGNYMSFMEFGSDFRFYEKSTSALSLDAQILEGSYKSWKNSDNFIAQTASDPSNYYAKFSANYNYAQAFDIKAKGAGSEWTIMKWADAAGLEFNGGANKVIKFADSNYLDFGTMTTANQFDIDIGAQTTSRGIRIAPYISWGTRYSGWDNWIGTNVSTQIGTTASGVQQMTSYTTSGAAALNIGFQELSFYNWSPATLSGNAAHTSLTIPTPRFRITAAGDLQINGTTIVNAGATLSAPTVAGLLNVHRNYTNGGIGFAQGYDANHHLWNDYYGGPGSRGAAGSGFDGIKWNTYRGIHIRGGTGGAYNLIRVQNSSGNTNDHAVTLYNSNAERFVTQTEGAYVNGALYASASGSENTPYNTDNTHVFRNEGSVNNTNGGGTLFVNDRGNHSWGTVAEFRINTAGDSDNPSIIFSSAAEGTNTWGIGYGYIDTSFRINRDHGHHNGTWGTAMMTLDRSGNATFAGNVTAYSDRRLKENIETIPNALDTIKQVRGVTFDWKENGERSMGVIAQELEEVEILKCLVRETPKDGVSEFAQKNVAYGNMVGLLIEAIKEQSAQINAQQEQINQLTNLVNALMEK